MNPLVSAVKKTLLVQIVLILVISILGWFFAGESWAYGLLLGGLCTILGTLVHGLIMGKISLQESKTAILKMAGAELAKLTVGAGALALAFVFLPLPPLPLLLGFIAGALSQWVTPLVIKTPGKVL